MASGKYETSTTRNRWCGWMQLWRREPAEVTGRAGVPCWGIWGRGVLVTAGLFGLAGLLFGQAPPRVKTPHAVEREAVELQRKHQPLGQDAVPADAKNRLHIPIVLIPVQAPSERKPPAAAERKFRGRLPTHYSQVVNDQQRQFIYSLQWRYQQEIRKYENHLRKLKADRDKLIYDVLTPVQKEQLRLLKK